MEAARSQLQLFRDRNLNIVYEIKRQIRLALCGTNLSRDQVMDEMNRLASRDGVNKKAVTRATVDSWCKDSEPGRLPSLNGLVVFCAALGTQEPVRAMLKPLGADVIGPEEVGLLAWARAEQARRKAAKKARLAQEELDLR